jgi:GT2 family glycosyltransferase
MVYRRFVWEKSGRFDESFRNYGEDSDFAKRVLATCGEIGFDKDLIVIHQEKKRKLETIFIRYKDRVSSQVLYEIKNGKGKLVVINPLDLLIIFFPVFLLCYHRFKRPEDIKYAFFLYCAIVYSRFCIWKLAIRNKKWIL